MTQSAVKVHHLPRPDLGPWIVERGQLALLLGGLLAVALLRGWGLA